MREQYNSIKGQTQRIKELEKFNIQIPTFWLAEVKFNAHLVRCKFINKQLDDLVCVLVYKCLALMTYCFRQHTTEAVQGLTDVFLKRAGQRRMKEGYRTGHIRKGTNIQCTILRYIK